MIKQKLRKSVYAAALLAFAFFAVSTPAQAQFGLRRGGGWGRGMGYRTYGYGLGARPYGYAYRPYGYGFRPFGGFYGGFGARNYVAAPMLYNRGFYGGYGAYGIPGYGYGYPYGGSYFGGSYITPGYW